MGRSRSCHGVLRLLCAGWNGGLLILARFQLGAIFWRKDLFAFQVVSSVNVPGFFLLSFFAGAFLTSGFRDVLIFLALSLVLRLVLGAARNNGTGDR